MNEREIRAHLNGLDNQLHLLRAHLTRETRHRDDPACSIYIPNIAESVKQINRELDEKPANLLAHLCSLTVAERETILRISDLVAQTWCYDEYASDKDRVFNAIQLVRDVEAELRTPI